MQDVVLILNCQMGDVVCIYMQLLEFHKHTCLFAILVEYIILLYFISGSDPTPTPATETVTMMTPGKHN